MGCWPRYEFTYRGVFVSPFDYDMTLGSAELARVVLKYGGQITEEQKIAMERIDRLESLGGIREPPKISQEEILNFIETSKAKLPIQI
ncbi:hypothetical protein HYT25_01550 [Candidatus Pacearchaeota archaeon]|nr:hypothetical protein [Candidatus Pacearchaeota archaeon]